MSKWNADISAAIAASGNSRDNEPEVHRANWGLKEEPEKNLLSSFRLI